MNGMLRHGALAACALLLCALSTGAAMPGFEGGTAWIDSPPLTASALRGDVVLVDFWEYTCLNCLRTLPYLRAWYRRYRNDGFTIVGVQTPEFGFSGRRDNVQQAVKRLGIDWPVVLDANNAIWDRFGVSAWPTEMIFDQDGRLVHAQIGEGGYPETETVIQALLKARHPRLALPAPMALLPQDSYDKPGAVCYPHTPEILVESTQIADPANGDAAQDLLYSDTGDRKEGAIYLDGYWHATKEALVSGGGAGYFDLVYRAIQVTAVMTPSNGPVRVDVTQDGKPIAKQDAGSDVQYDAAGHSYVQVDAPRDYDVVMNNRYGEHDLRLSPQASGLGIYDVDFESCQIPGAS